MIEKPTNWEELSDKDKAKWYSDKKKQTEFVLDTIVKEWRALQNKGSILKSVKK